MKQKTLKHDSYLNKILTPDDFYLKSNQLKQQGKKIIFTNGCFDILHPGHVRYLFEAKSLGGYLFLGINNDASVKKLKGKNRPINCLEDRMEVLAALSCVDYITHYSETTPIKLIKKILPDFLIKGGDWSVKDIVGNDEVIKAGGSVLAMGFIKEKSTTKVIKNILDRR